MASLSDIAGSFAGGVASGIRANRAEDLQQRQLELAQARLAQQGRLSELSLAQRGTLAREAGGREQQRIDIEGERADAEIARGNRGVAVQEGRLSELIRSNKAGEMLRSDNLAMQEVAQEAATSRAQQRLDLEAEQAQAVLNEQKDKAMAFDKIEEGRRVLGLVELWGNVNSSIGPAKDLALGDLNRGLEELSELSGQSFTTRNAGDTVLIGVEDEKGTFQQLPNEVLEGIVEKYQDQVEASVYRLGVKHGNPFALDMIEKRSNGNLFRVHSGEIQNNRVVIIGKGGEVLVTPISPEELPKGQPKVTMINTAPAGDDPLMKPFTVVRQADDTVVAVPIPMQGGVATEGGNDFLNEATSRIQAAGQ